MIYTYIIIIMLVTGILGGLVNYFSDSNRKIIGDTEIRIRKPLVCVLLGVAATVLVPFFLKLADSKLIDNIQFQTIAAESDSTRNNNHKLLNIYVTKDSLGKIIKQDTAVDTKQKLSADTKPSSNVNNTPQNNARDYLLWTAYCLLAAAAGMRFIDMLISKMLTQAEVKRLEIETQQVKVENKDLKKEVSQTKKADEKRKNNLAVSEIEQTTAPQVIISGAMKTIISNPPDPFDLTQLPPITNSNDPQKGRFGGLSEVNERKLSVSFANYFIPNFLNLTIKVESLKNDDPLKGDVYFFLHDSFAKSVIKINANGEKEVTYTIPSYGAFTIGAVADHGNTKLELDIASLSNFPEDFRKR